jgi:hypothetical protein
MSLGERLTNFIERTVLGPGHFHLQAAVLRTLIKFLDDHDNVVSPESPLRKCLSALEAGEKSAALSEYHRVVFGKGGLPDWYPAVKCSCETQESASMTFICLLTRWQRDMEELAGKRPAT